MHRRAFLELLAAAPLAAITPRPAPRGLVGDGVTDDTAALQRLLQGAGLVVLPPGVYRVTQPLVVGSDTTIRRCRFINGGGAPWILMARLGARNILVDHCRFEGGGILLSA